MTSATVSSLTISCVFWQDLKISLINKQSSSAWLCYLCLSLSRAESPFCYLHVIKKCRDWDHRICIFWIYKHRSWLVTTGEGLSISFSDSLMEHMCMLQLQFQVWHIFLRWCLKCHYKKVLWFLDRDLRVVCGPISCTFLYQFLPILLLTVRWRWSVLFFLDTYCYWVMMRCVIRMTMQSLIFPS